MIFDIESKEFANLTAKLYRAHKKNELGENYKRRVAHANRIKLHACEDPDNPRLMELLDLVRPNEEPPVKAYRKGAFMFRTVGEFERLQNAIYSIFDKRNYSITWPDKFAPMAGDNTLRNYLEKEFPKWGSMLKYFQDFVYNSALTDPNSVFLIYPTNAATDEQDKFLTPFPFWFPTEKVLEYTDEYCVIMDFHGPNGEKEMYVADFEKVIYGIEIERKDGESYFEWEVVYTHNLGYVPVLKMPGTKTGSEDSLGEYGEDYQESYIRGVLPSWDKAVLKDSDQDAVEVMQGFPKFWHYKIKCNKCGGEGKVQNAGFGVNGNIGHHTCTSCKGTGIEKGGSPFDSYAIDMRQAGNENISMPPGGYMNPDSAILDFGARRVEDHINHGFSSVNAHHLINKTAPDASGESKFQDKTEFNKYLGKVSAGLWDLFIKTTKIIAQQRYGPAKIWKEEDLPMVSPPVEFDIYSAADISRKFSEAKAAGASADYLTMLQLEGIKKEFGENSKQAKEFGLIISLDPFPNVTADEMLAMKSDTREEDRWLHSNIKRLIQKAQRENAGFLDMDGKKQSDIIYAYVAEELKARPKPVMPTPDPNDTGATF